MIKDTKHYIMIKHGFSQILTWMYPPRCAVCDQILPLLQKDEKDIYNCPKCKRLLKYIKEPSCKKCGKSISFETQEYCFDCDGKKFYFTQGKAVFSYEGAIKHSLYRFKYANRKEYAKFYANEMTKKYEKWIKSMSPDVIIPIPLHVKRKRIRGYNQAEEIAKLLGKSLNIPVDTSYILRNKNTVALKQLSAEERKKNLKNAFNITEDNVKYNCIILVDDIYTTGNTINEVARIMKNAGIEHIYFICVSIGKGY